MSTTPEMPSGHTAEDTTLDALLSGELYVDLIFTNVDGFPRPGTEVYAEAMAMSPGGIANVAVGLARLGARTGLVSVREEGMLGQWLERSLSAAGVDLRHVRVEPGWSQSVTVSVAADGDRAMLSHHESGQAPALSGPLPAARLYFEVIDHDLQPLVMETRRPAGSLLVCDCAWDPRERWSATALQSLDGADVFVPNAAEAMAFTRTDSPLAAARELSARVPLVIVKCGRQGVVAVDAGSGATHLSPALEVRAVDPTGAGDVFVAGFMYAALHDLPLAEQLAFANLCAGVSVTRRGGAMGAPSLGGIDAALAAMGAEERARYAFVKQLLAKNAEPGRNPSSDQSLHSEVHVV